MRMARINSEMQTLAARFLLSQTVNNPDGTTSRAIYWTNADAERRYNELRKQVQPVRTVERGLDGNDTRG